MQNVLLLFLLIDMGIRDTGGRVFILIVKFIVKEKVLNFFLLLFECLILIVYWDLRYMFADNSDCLFCFLAY